MKSILVKTRSCFFKLGVCDVVALLPLMDTLSNCIKSKKAMEIVIDVNDAARIFKVLSDIGFMSTQDVNDSIPY